MWHVLDTTRFSFRRYACARKIDDVETCTRVRTRRVAEVRMHVRYVHAKSGLRTPWRVYKL